MQKLMADLFQIGMNTVNHHLKEIYAEGEQQSGAAIRRYRIVQIEGARKISREVEHYNLPAILTVGFRVRSRRGTQFRQWATERLGEYLLKGFTMDDAQTHAVFQIVQNKLHFAATGKPAAELVAARADAAKTNMGLTNWKSGSVRKGDVTIARNYLNVTEIGELNRIVVMFLDFAEDQALRRKQIFLNQWQIKLDEFLRFNERAVLSHASAVSRGARTTRPQRSMKSSPPAAAPGLKPKARLMPCVYLKVPPKNSRTERLLAREKGGA